MKKIYSLLFLTWSLPVFCQTVPVMDLDFKYDSISGIVNVSWNSLNEEFQDVISSDLVKIGNNSNFSISEGVLQLTRSSGQVGIYSKNDFSNYEFETKIKVISGSGVYPSNYIDIWLNTQSFDATGGHQGIKFEYASGKWTIIEVPGNTIVPLTSSPNLNTVIGSENKFKFTSSDDSIKIYINDVFQKSIHCSRKTGKIGIFSNTYITNASIDYIKINPMVSTVRLFEILRNGVLLKKVYDYNFSDTLTSSGNYSYIIVTRYLSGNSDSIRTKNIFWQSVYFKDIVVKDGKSVTINATLSSSKNITAAEYFIDSIGENGTGIPFKIIDGSYDEKTEEIQSNINIVAPDSVYGIHKIFFHAKNENNAWSTILSKEFLFIQPFVTTVPEDFSIIQEAIDKSDPGNIIFIRDGYYIESIKINKKIKLYGEAKKRTIICDRSFTIVNTSFAEIHNLILIGERFIIDSSNNIKISGCKINGNKNLDVGIDLIYSSNNIIENCEIENLFYQIPNETFNPSYGIRIQQHSNNNLIKNCKIHNLSSNSRQCAGIFIDSSDNNFVCKSIIYDNKPQHYGASCMGILINSSTNSFISSNNIHTNMGYDGGYNELKFYGCGISLVNTKGDTICGNVIKNNSINRGYSYGILISGNSNPVIGSATNLSNVIMNKGYNVANLTGNTINATFNYWGTEKKDDIAKTIYDCADNVNFACVNYENYTSPLLFLSKPIYKAFVGSLYVYNINVDDFSNKEFSLLADTLPSWLSLTLNENSTYNLTGYPSIDFLGKNKVVLKAISDSDTTFQSFTINVYEVPKISLGTISGITDNSAIYSGIITFNGIGKISNSGVCWSNTNNFPDTTDFHKEIEISQNSFSTSLTGLNEITKYYVRSYTILDNVVYYGEVVTFETTLKPLSIITGKAFSITESSANFSVSITYNGDCWFTEMGICWNTSGNPTITDAHSITESKEGDFLISITGLEKDKKYYARAYGKLNIDSVFYGNEVSFTATPNSSEDDNSFNFLIYPNPANGEFFIKDSSYNGLPYKIQIYNSFGALTLIKNGYFETEPINIKVSGIYYLKITKGKASLMKKIIILRNNNKKLSD